MTDHL